MEGSSVSLDQIIILIIAGSLIMVAMAMALIAYFGISRKRILQVENQKQQLKLSYQSELIQSNIITQEQERHRIATNLHDDIGSKLNIIKLYTHQLSKPNITPEKRNSLTKEIHGTLQSTIDTTRSISHQLIPPTLDNFGLVAAIRELVEDVNNAETINIQFDDAKDIQLSNKSAALNLFRIVQELIQNSIKYGGELIQIDLSNTNGSTIVLNYADNGPGYEPQSVNAQKGLGHLNIQNRIEIIRGKFSNLSAIGKGARYQIEYYG